MMLLIRNPHGYNSQQFLNYVKSLIHDLTTPAKNFFVKDYSFSGSPKEITADITTVDGEKLHGHMSKDRSKFKFKKAS